MEILVRQIIWCGVPKFQENAGPPGPLLSEKFGPDNGSSMSMMYDCNCKRYGSALKV